MRALSKVAAILVFVLAVPVAAQEKQKEQSPRLVAANTAATTARPANAKPKPAAKPATEKPEPKPAASAEASAVAAELQLLRQVLEEQRRELEAQRALLKQQQDKMNEMERNLEARTTPPSAPNAVAQEEDQNGKPVTEEQLEAVAESVKSTTDRVAKVEKDVTANKSQADGKLRQLGNFTFSGDFRGRFESFTGGTLAPNTDRFRERFRLRFNINARFSDEFTGGLTLASGDLTDPISTNQSMTGFYQRKVIAIDKAFLTYTPKWFKNWTRDRAALSITGGKFAYTWFRTEMTFDNDLNVEGLSPTISIPIKTSILKQINFVGYVLPFNEAGSARDSYMAGGQLQTQWQFGPRLRVNTNIGFMDFNGADRIKVAQNNLTASVTGGGGGSVTIPNSAGLTGSTNSNSASATQFASQFGLLNAQFLVNVNTGVNRFPIQLLFDYVNNTRACTNRTAAGTPVVPTQNGACNPRDREGFWSEIQFGRSSEAKDVQFGYTFMRIEREAVLAAFNFSDLRSPSNTASHRVNFTYTVNPKVSFGWTGLFGRQLVTASSLTPENFLKRMQLDFVYKF